MPQLLICNLYFNYTSTSARNFKNKWNRNEYVVDCHYQCAVRAATNGRVLILEGIEKAERNVLPVLNNLLENREMQLDDGRFLMSASRYDKLLKVVDIDCYFCYLVLGYSKFICTDQSLSWIFLIGI